MEKSHRSREAWTRWSETVARWRASGETSKEFAARHGLNAGTLLYWSSRLSKTSKSSTPAKRGRGASSFTQVVVAEAPVTAAPSRLEVVARSGHCVRVEGAVDAAALRAVLEVVESC